MISSAWARITYWLEYENGWSTLVGWALFISLCLGAWFYFPGPWIRHEWGKHVVVLNAGQQRAFAVDQMWEKGLRYNKENLLPLRYTYYPDTHETWIQARVTGPDTIRIEGSLKFRIAYPNDIYRSIAEGQTYDYYDPNLCSTTSDVDYDSEYGFQYRWITCEGGYVNLKDERVIYLDIWYLTNDPVFPLDGIANQIPGTDILIVQERLLQRGLGEPNNLSRMRMPK